MNFIKMHLVNSIILNCRTKSVPNFTTASNDSMFAVLIQFMIKVRWVRQWQFEALLVMCLIQWNEFYLLIIIFHWFELSIYLKFSLIFDCKICYIHIYLIIYFVKYYANKNVLAIVLKATLVFMYFSFQTFPLWPYKIDIKCFRWRK